MVFNNGAFGENFPYTNFHDINLDWIIKTLKDLQKEFIEYSAINQIVFADPPEWSIDNYYKKNTLVIDSALNGYIALQDVPSGIPLTNSDYWKLVFPFAENVETLREEVMQYINQQLGVLETELTNVFNYAKTKETNNNNRHVIVLGDSYVKYYNDRLYYNLLAFAGLNADYCTNLAVSGASFHNNANSFTMQLQSYTGEKTDITDIIVLGGINDAVLTFPTDTTTLTNAMGDFVTYLNSNYTNARVYIFYVGGCMPNTTYYNTHNANSQEWTSYYYMNYFAGAGYKTCIIDALHLIDAYYSSDGVHPSESGVTRIAHEIACRMSGLTTSIKIPPYGVPIVENQSLYDLTATVNYSVNNGVVSIDIERLIAYVPASFSFNHGSALKIGDLVNCRVRSKVSASTELTLNLFNPDNENFIQINGSLFIQNGSIYLEPCQVGDTGWNNYTSRSDSSNTAYIAITQPVTLTTSLFNIN